MAADPTDVSDDRSGDLAPEAVAVQELYERHAARVYSFCLHHLGNREEAEDATQSTFLNAFRGLRRGVAPVAETAWLLAIARNVCLTRVRSTVRRRRLEAPRDLQALQDTVPARAAAGGDELLWLGPALAGLPANQRRAILLREWQGLSYEEIAADLGTTHGAVETLIFRGRRTLARRLEVAPGPRRLPQRVARWVDFGAAASWAKAALLAGGTAKAVATATVVATVAVAGSAPLRHDEPPAAASPAPPSGTRTLASAPPTAWAVLSEKTSNAPVRVNAKRVASVRRIKPTTRGGSAPPPPPPTNGRRSAGPLAADETSETRTESPTGRRPRRPVPRVGEREKPTETPAPTNDDPTPAPTPTAPPEQETEPVDEDKKEKKEKEERPDREQRDNDDDEGEDDDEREEDDDERGGGQGNEDDEDDDEDEDDDDDEKGGQGRP